MKKYSKVMLLLVLVFGLIFVSGCGKKEDDKKATAMKEAAGTYVGKYSKFVGDQEKNEEEEFSLELKEDGTGKNNRDGGSFNVEWSIDGTEFKMTDKFGSLTIDYNGTLKDGVLHIYNGDKDNDLTYEYYYEKK